MFFHSFPCEIPWISWLQPIFSGGLSLVPVGQPRGFAAGTGHEPETGAGAPVSGDKEMIWEMYGKCMVNVW